MRPLGLAAVLAVLVAVAVLIFRFMTVEPERPAPPVAVEPQFQRIAPREAESLAESMSPLVQGIPSWSAFKPALEKSLEFARVKKADALAVDRPGLTLTWGELTNSIEEMISLLPLLDSNPSLMAERFHFYRLDPITLLTGYYEPWIEASPTQSEKYPYPLYGLPKDHKTVDLGKFHPRWKGQKLVYRIGENGVEPYHDRKSIDGDKALEGMGAEIAWTRNLVDIFMLQVQGSGRMVMPDGSVQHILYAGKNGHQYVSIGRLLIDQGYVPREEMNMNRIREFIAQNPVIGERIMFQNPSYVFFRLNDEGPYGSAGKVLTPMVSVAVDRTFVPLGSLMLLDGLIPRVGGGGDRPFRSMVTAQDTGGAIKTTRCDLFCGTGPDAEFLAGHLQHEATLFLLVSKEVLSRRPLQ